TINNAGTFAYNGSGTYTVYNVALNNSGMVEVLSGGTLALQGGGTSTGDYNVGALSALTMGGGHSLTGSDFVTGAGSTTTFDGSPTQSITNITMTGSGDFVKSGSSTLTATHSTTLALPGNFTQSGGIIDGTSNWTIAGGATVTGGTFANIGNVAIAGVMSWTGGQIGNSGVTGTVTVSGMATMSGVSQKILYGKTLTLSGNASHAAGQILIGYGGVLTVSTGSTFTATGGGIQNAGNPPYTINNAGTFAYNGSGTYTVNYVALNNSGILDIASGTVQIENLNNTASGVVKGAGTLTWQNAANNNGHIAPGASPGCLTINGNVDNYILDIEIGGTTVCTDYDQLIVNGTFDASSSTLNTSAYNSFVPTVGDVFMIVNNDGNDAIIGTFSGLPEGGTINNFLGSVNGASITYIGGDGNDIVLTTIAGLCPAPSTQVSDIAFSNKTQTSMDVSWTNGNGAGRVVIMNTSNSFTDPTDGSNPTANPVYGGSGEQVIYNGSLNSVSVSGLTAGTTYWFRAYEYCTPDRTYNTTTASGNPNSQTTCRSYTWAGGTGDWADPSKWTPNGVPGACDNVTMTSGNITVNSNQQVSNLTMSGTLSGSGPLTINGTFANTGHISPGASPGCLTIVGNITNSILDVEIGGTTVCTDYDQLNVTGNFTAAGTLHVSQYSGFNPAVSDEFTIVTTTGTVSGTFATLTFDAPYVVGDWNVVYNANNIKLVYNPLPVHNITQNTYYGTIQAAVNAANANDVIEAADGTYNERVTINKSLTLQGQSEAGVILEGTGLSGTGSGITVNSGIANVTIEKMTIQNYTGSSPNGNAGIWLKGSNNGFKADQVTIKDNVNAAGIFAAGPVDGFTVTNSTVSNHGPGARGIVIWDGFKQNINISNNTVSNNNCCGIELQDGDASAVNITGNTINIGGGDNAIGLVGLNATVGNNTVNNNTIIGGGRFGIEIKNPAGGVTVNGNSVTMSTYNADLRDRAGIAILRRGVGNSNVDVPNGVTITGNTVDGYQQTSNSEGFGIVVEGINHTVTGNTVNNSDVGILQQQNPSNYPLDADQSNLSDQYFGRGNSPMTCGNTISGNTFSGNGTDTRNIGVGGGIVTNTTTLEVFCSIQSAIDDAQTLGGHTLSVGNGTYNERVTVNKSLKLQGQSEAGVILEGTGLSGT
ncbi:MAG TPA: right-handed parallel beta-helix repeat-containing protein, partial [Saprospiraceae bacterium]|nr:right-handed parallel beta-helix repeat-containing protein [Saprospiraceae bacterium]